MGEPEKLSLAEGDRRIKLTGMDQGREHRTGQRKRAEKNYGEQPHDYRPKYRRRLYDLRLSERRVRRDDGLSPMRKR